MRELLIHFLFILILSIDTASAQAPVCSPVGRWSDNYGYVYNINAQMGGTVDTAPCGVFSLTVSGTNPFTAIATNLAQNSSCVASFTMIMTFSASSCDTASGTWTNTAGGSGTDTWARLAALSIQSPANASTYAIHTPVPFNASGNFGTPVDWDLRMSYTTSGGRGPFIIPSTLTTTPGATTEKTFDATGGQLTATASQNAMTQSVMLTVTGVAVPATDITARLVTLYAAGSTPRLLTGIAQKESSYLQFSQRTLYNQSALWPRESFDGGSHIGVMQMPVSMQMAWDWMANTQGAAALFNQKISFAKRFESRIRAAHSNLPALTGTQIENMALVFYGPYATSSIHGQYYDASCIGGIVDTTGTLCVGGQWQWIVNTAGNTSGVSYADSVRSLIQ